MRSFSRFLSKRQELSEFLQESKGLRLIQRRQEETDQFIIKRYFPNAFAPVNPLDKRQTDQAIAEFDTSSSDDDAKYFSLRRWVSDALMLHRVSPFRILIHMVASVLAFYISIQLSTPLFQSIRNTTFLGHWRLHEPAYLDMELSRFKQRIQYSKLTAYD